VTDYTRTPPGNLTTRQVAITSVDVVNHGAMGSSGTSINIPIDTSYYVGATQVTPTIGDQWTIQKLNGDWRLVHRLPFNDPNQASVTPTQGQHVVGSGQGPVELQGSVVNVNAPLAIQPVPTTGRPVASSVAPGTQVYDTNLSLPIWSNGTVWHDAVGNVV
jgi:hypothetical protein